MKRQKGFALIQVIIAASIMSFLALAMGSLIADQTKATAYLEDQLTKIDVARNFQAILKDGLACQQSLQGVTVDLATSVNLSDLKDNSGATVFSSSSVHGKLAIGQIRVTNDTLPGPSSTGFVDIIMPLSRVRSGGGPKEFKALEFKAKVTVDASLQVLDCASSVIEVLEPGTGYNGQTGHVACTSIGKTCGYVTSRNYPAIYPGCMASGSINCVRVCQVAYSRSLPGVPNTAVGNDIHSCDARIGTYTTHIAAPLVTCRGLFSAVCIDY